jgi:hypothetical protein
MRKRARPDDPYYYFSDWIEHRRRDGQVIRMKEEEGMTFRQIAAFMGISAGRVGEVYRQGKRARMAPEAKLLLDYHNLR